MGKKMGGNLGKIGGPGVRMYIGGPVGGKIICYAKAFLKVFEGMMDTKQNYWGVFGGAMYIHTPGAKMGGQRGPGRGKNG